MTGEYFLLLLDKDRCHVTAVMACLLYPQLTSSRVRSSHKPDGLYTSLARPDTLPSLSVSQLTVVDTKLTRAFFDHFDLFQFAATRTHA